MTFFDTFFKREPVLEPLDIVADRFKAGSWSKLWIQYRRNWEENSKRLTWGQFSDIVFGIVDELAEKTQNDPRNS